jgi:uncharacterized protein YqeY
MALAKFKETDIEWRLKNVETTPEPELIVVLTKMVKQRKESAQTYRDNAREDAALKELAEIDVLNEYLPKPLSEDEVSQAITQAISESEAKDVNDTGKVVAYLKEKYSGQIDFGKIVPHIRQKLSA